MIGVDTSFLVAFELLEHDKHDRAVELARDRSSEGFALTPQVIGEFLHVVTDERRFETPLTMGHALELAEVWWSAEDTVLLYPSARAVSLFIEWMGSYRLGRKRILDTQLASLLHLNDVATILTTDWRAFATFPGPVPILLD